MTPDEVFDSISQHVSYPLTITLKPSAKFENGFYLSGQVAMREGALIATGLVGDQVSIEVAQECFRSPGRIPEPVLGRLLPESLYERVSCTPYNLESI